MQLNEVHLNPDSPGVHTCNSVKNGDWIIFTCDQCKGYERRLNWKTGEMKINSGGSMAQHSGVYIPVGVEFNSLSLS